MQLLCMGVKHGHTSKEMQLEETKGKCDIYSDSGTVTWNYLDSGTVTWNCLDSGIVTWNCLDSGIVTWNCVDSGTVTCNCLDSDIVTWNCLDSGTVTWNYLPYSRIKGAWDSVVVKALRSRDRFPVVPLGIFPWYPQQNHVL